MFDQFYKKDKGYFNYINVGAITNPNNIVNTEKDPSELVDYFTSGIKTDLQTKSFSAASLSIQDILLQEQTRNLLKQGPPTVPFFEENTIDTVTQFASNQA